MTSSSSVFEFHDRYGENTMSQRAYVSVLSLLIAGGLIFATFVGSVTYSMKPNWLWLVAYFMIAIPGIVISAKSENWIVSLVGYLMVIVATGAIIGPYTHLYTPASVLQVALITIGVSVGIGFMGAIYPKSVEHWGGFLLMALLLIIFGDLSRMFMTAYGVAPVAFKWWDWIAAALFSGLIFYDMNRAMRLPYTMDNAVDSAVALYLDIVNLFIRLLAILGKKSD